MKRIFLMIGILIVYLMPSAFGQNKNIMFSHNGSFKEKLAAAKNDKKLIFIDCYTSWCVPCKVLAKDVFTVDSIADFFNANFINLGYDMEKGEGLELKKKYESDINAYPTLLFVNGDGEIVHKIVGAPSAENLLALVRPALDPATSMKGLASKFEKGDRSLSTVSAYFKILGNASDPEKEKEVATAYFDALPSAGLIKPETWTLLAKYLHNLDSKTYRYILNNRPVFEKAVGKAETETYLLDNLAREVGGLSNAYYMKKPVNPDRIDWLTKTIGLIKNEKATLLLMRIELVNSRNANDWATFNTVMTKVISSTSLIKDPEIAIAFMLNFTRRFATTAPSEHLEDAIAWADLLLQKDVSPVYKTNLLNFKKSIYIKMGKTELAAAADEQIAYQKKVKAEAEQKGQNFHMPVTGFF